VKRLQRELRIINKEPVPYCVVLPAPKNILEWHYVLFPPPGTVYEDGEYHGRIVFPPQYPYKPPAIYMDTPSGRFIPSKSICLSMSEYHPEAWNPLWCVSTIISGLLSFMLEDTKSTGTVESTKAKKIQLAHKSEEFNNKDHMFRILFSDNVSILEYRIKRRENRALRAQQEQENQISAQELSASRIKILIVTGIGAVLLALFSMLVQVWMKQQQ